MTAYCVVLTTVATPQEAASLARVLVEQQLAACVQRVPINSTYWWEGAVQEEPETLLLIKTETAGYPAVEACIKANHRYTVPEIVCLPVEAGSRDYLHWITETVRRTSG